MTLVIAINDQNDMFLDSTNNLALATGQEAVAQAAQTASKAQLGEMIYFTTQGMPSFQSIFIGTPNVQIYRSALVQAIEAINGVVSVTSILVSQVKDNMNYTAEIETIYGSLIVNG